MSSLCHPTPGEMNVKLRHLLPESASPAVFGAVWLDSPGSGDCGCASWSSSADDCCARLSVASTDVDSDLSSEDSSSSSSPRHCSGSESLQEASCSSTEANSPPLPLSELFLAQASLALVCQRLGLHYGSLQQQTSRLVLRYKAVAEHLIESVIEDMRLALDEDIPDLFHDLLGMTLEWISEARGESERTQQLHIDSFQILFSSNEEGAAATAEKVGKQLVKVDICSLRERGCAVGRTLSAIVDQLVAFWLKLEDAVKHLQSVCQSGALQRDMVDSIFPACLEFWQDLKSQCGSYLQASAS
eukprot:TRINITY_DN15289_c0_g1_i3.p1 TRINITY_DN15289_c0_g1~~TRINITY_DN15289_c0_g1_i3.p1  ORF type:complete len:323 (+),score=35.82 TRINITY_DN15289_c0_g1_i3:69-971(+)